MNFQVTVLKILVSYRGGFAVMADLKRDMAILATSGRDWAERTKRLAARMPHLDIFSQGLVERESGGWKITEKGRTVVEFLEARPGIDPTLDGPLTETVAAAVPALRQPAERAKRRRERRERRREARERARATASQRHRAACCGASPTTRPSSRILRRTVVETWEISRRSKQERGGRGWHRTGTQHNWRGADSGIQVVAFTGRPNRADAPLELLPDGPRQVALARGGPLRRVPADFGS